jgi:undecaprenyl-diphosphatase
VTLAVLALFAAVQGLCEFLPVSSSGHLALVQRLLGFSEPPVLFNVSLHVGTLAAILWIYRREARRVVVAGVRWLVRPPRRNGTWRSLAPADEAETEALGIVLATGSRRPGPAPWRWASCSSSAVRRWPRRAGCARGRRR